MVNVGMLITGEANVKLLSMSTNGCGPGGTPGAHIITLGMVQPKEYPRWICQHGLIAPD